MNNEIMIEGAKILFRNFKGEERGEFNKEGDRNFCVILEDEELVSQMERDGWNIKYLQPRDEHDSPQPYMSVKVAFGGRFPLNAVMISKRGKTILDENSIAHLDVAEIANIDLVIRPYTWTLHAGTKHERSGVKAYLKSIWATLVEDPFEAKYYDVADSI